MDEMNSNQVGVNITHSLYIALLLCLLLIAPSYGQGIESYYCEEEVVKCGNGMIAHCSDPTMVPTCISKRAGLLGQVFPDCCRKENDGLGSFCRPSALVCPNSPDEFKNISAGVAEGPVLPELETLDLERRNSVIGSDVAFPGSNPSYVLNLPRDFNSEVKTVEIKDSSDNVYAIDAFEIAEVAERKKMLVTLTIPEAISLGDAFFALNLDDGTRIVAKIRIIEPTPVSQSRKKKSMNKVRKIKISRAQFIGGGVNIRLSMRASNVVGNRIFYLVDGNVQSKKNKKSDPFTKVTILPKSLVNRIDSVRIKKRKKSVVVKVVTKDRIPASNQPVVIILSSPSSITSVSTNLIQSVANDEENQDGIFCRKRNGKPRCPDGRPARCKDARFTPKCEYGVPDCCRFRLFKDEYDKFELDPICRPKKLFCRN